GKKMTVSGVPPKRVFKVKKEDETRRQLEEERKQRERLERELEQLRAREEEREEMLREEMKRRAILEESEESSNRQASLDERTDENEKRKILDLQKNEALKLQLEKEKAKEEEREAEKDVESRRKMVQDKKKKRVWIRINELNYKKARVERIKHLKEQLKLEEDRLLEICDRSDARDKALEEEEKELKKAKNTFLAKRTARMKATRQADDNPYSESLRYSRKCSICLILNPSQRAVMVACGHMTCATCAEEILQQEDGSIACPFCRKETTYVKTFEDLETPEVRHEAPETRKRKHDGPDEDLQTIKKDHRTRYYSRLTDDSDYEISNDGTSTTPLIT
ncbi:hypothetical protein PENTCL1PPCAC_7566, partial [Pristionchus entomophagus]